MLWISKWTGPNYCSSRDLKSLVATSSMSRHRSNVATSTLVSAAFNWSFLMSRHQSLVATSLYAFARFNWLLMMSRHQSLVATSTYVFGGFTGCFWCRDFNPLSRQQLESHQFHFFKPVIALRRFSCRDLHPLSRHQPLSRHHDVVATSFLKPLVNPQLPNL